MPTSIEQPVSFMVDGMTLSGVLHLPYRTPIAAIIGCHGLMADKNSPKQVELARRCAATGMAYFRFDHRGCGESTGVFEKDTTLENRQSDLLAAVRAVGNTLGKTMPTGLFGSSLGGTVCLTASQRISPFAIVTVAAPVQSRNIRIPENSPESLKEEINGNRLSFDITTHLKSIDHILVVHGSNDETVALENAHSIYHLARDPKQRLILKGGDHRISKRSHQKRFMQNALKWYMACYKDRFCHNPL